MQKKYSLLLSVLILLLFILSCSKERKSPFWDVDILAPLIKSTLSINNIVTDSLLHQNSDNSLDIVYNTNLNSFSLNSVFQIPDTAISSVFPIFTNTPINLSPCSIIIASINDETKYKLNNVELTKVIIRSGKMKIFITNNIDGNIEFNYKLPYATSLLTGKVFDTTFIVPKRINSTTPGVYSENFDLSNYTFDLKGVKGDSYNTIVKNISAKAPCNGPTITLNSGDYLKVENSFLGIVPEYAKGYFGTAERRVSSTTYFSLFKHIINGTLDLQSVKIGLSIENSIGDDARITIDTLSSINSRTGQPIFLKHSIIGSAINLNRAVDNNGNVTPSTYSVSLTPTNSNIRDFVNNLPDKLKFAFDLNVNPLGTNVSGGNDFIYYGKYIKTDFNMTIPLSFIANDLTMADTLNFNFPSSANNVNSGNIYLYAENGFPFTAVPQLYLMDAKFNIIDSLISAPNLILAPPLDANFICVGKKTTKLTFSVNEQKMARLRAAGKVYITMKFNTAGQPKYVKIYSFYEMNIKLVGDFNYTIGKK
jgi:hypothetical protein